MALPAVAAAGPRALEYETALVGDPPIVRPVSVTAGADASEICIVDEASRTIDVFDRHGLHRFRTDEVSGLTRPMDASIDDHGGFVLTDYGPDRQRTIRRLSFLGEPEPYEPEKPVDGWSPGHLVITRDGHYVTIDGSGLLAKHDADTGALLWSRQLVDPSWERSDLIGRPAEAADGRLYVPSAGMGTVIVVAADGSSHDYFGQQGTKRGEIAFPVGLTFTPGGLVLVLDQVRHTIVAYDAGHRFVDEFTHFGSGPGDIYFPVGIDALPDGRVFVAQGFEGRVQVYRMIEPGAETKQGATAASGDTP